jgi:hypothetical protein
VRKRDQPRARPQQLDLGQRQPRFELTAAATQGKLAQAQKVFVTRSSWLPPRRAD